MPATCRWSADGAPDQLLLVATDVTEQRRRRRRASRRPSPSARCWCAEVHHRIKNNPQGVAGLLQQIAAPKPEVQSVISEVVGQVQAIAQVYGPRSAAGRCVWPASSRRLPGLRSGEPSAQHRPCRSGDGGEGWGPPEAESPIPIALTINELLTNAIKHGTVGDDAGALHARLRRPGRAGS